MSFLGNILAVAESSASNAESSASNPVSSSLTLLFALGLAMVHLLAGKLQFVYALSRSRWLSFAGGASVAYVFVHIFPELSQRQESFEQSNNSILGFFEHHVYLVALLGLTIFYGLERLATESRRRQQKGNQPNSTSTSVFWVHIGSFAFYNALIGYLLLHREELGLGNLILFFCAMALHFWVNDYSLWEHHKDNYRHIGRWVLAGAVFLGWAIGLATQISEVALAMLFAFLAGGIILNVIKEELPDEQQSRFWSFALGATIYTALLLAL
jgi:hypothetical protein